MGQLLAERDRIPFRVDRELNPTRYTPYIYGIVLVNSICIGLIIILKRLADRKKA